MNPEVNIREPKTVTDLQPVGQNYLIEASIKEQSLIDIGNLQTNDMYKTAFNESWQYKIAGYGNTTNFFDCGDIVQIKDMHSAVLVQIPSNKLSKASWKKLWDADTDARLRDKKNKTASTDAISAKSEAIFTGMERVEVVEYFMINEFGLGGKWVNK